MRRITLSVSFVVLIACLTGACGSSLRVTSLQLGRSINEDETVANHTTVFGPKDTVYVSIQTAGAGSGTLSVRWLYRGQVVGEPKEEVSYRDIAATEFHLQNVGGFPPGEYSVEAFLDGQPVGTRTFKVENVR